MRKCRHSGLGRSTGSLASHLAIAVGLVGLVGCAGLAGLGESDPAAQSADVKTPAPAAPAASAAPAAPSAPTSGLDPNAKTDNKPSADIEVSSTTDFGQRPCNIDGAPTTIVIHNKSSTARNFTVIMPEGTPFSSPDPLSGTLPASDIVTVKVFAKPTLAGIVNANVVVTSGASFVTVPVGVVGIGGVLEWATAAADIGDTPYATDGTKTILLKNTGTADATVTGFTTKYESSPFSASPNSFTILARDSAAVTLKLAKGSTTVSPLSDELKPKAAGLCMAAPPKVTVTGRRVNNTVTVSGADWGMRDCNSTTSDRGNVLVRNYSFAALTWTLKTPLPTIYKLAPGAPTSGTLVAASGTDPVVATIPFTAPAAFPAAPLGALTESVTVTIAAAGLPALDALSIGDRAVTLKSDVRGAIVAVSYTAAPIIFTAATGTSTTQPFTITNTGTDAARISWAFVRTSGDPAWTGLPGTTSTTSGNGSTTVNLGFTAPSTADNRATLTPTRNGGGTICNPAALTVVNMTGKLQ